MVGYKQTQLYQVVFVLEYVFRTNKYLLDYSKSLLKNQ